MSYLLGKFEGVFVGEEKFIVVFGADVGPRTHATEDVQMIAGAKESLGGRTRFLERGSRRQEVPLQPRGTTSAILGPFAQGNGSIQRANELRRDLLTTLCLASRALDHGGEVLAK